MRTSQRTLFVDTATSHVYLALVEDGIESEVVYQEGINNHSVTVLPLLEAMLKRRGITLRDLTEVVVGIGPGSYTGVRIGVAIAKMIGYLNGTPVATVSSLALIASGAPGGKILPMIDARRGNAFMGLYEIADGMLRERIPDTLANVDAFVKEAGEGCELRKTGRPDAVRMLASGLPLPVADIHSLIPNYLQVTEAERKKADS